MRNTEFMIGDWVFSPMEYPYKVAELHREYAHLDNSAGSMSEIMPTIGVKYKALSPIPLTAEILEKNPKVKEQGYWDKESDLFRLYACPVINLYFVHRCQHALRLCGLDELANNFIIK